MTADSQQGYDINMMDTPVMGAQLNLINRILQSQHPDKRHLKDTQHIKLLHMVPGLLVFLQNALPMVDFNPLCDQILSQSVNRGIDITHPKVEREMVAHLKAMKRDLPGEKVMEMLMDRHLNQCSELLTGWAAGLRIDNEDMMYLIKICMFLSQMSAYKAEAGSAAMAHCHFLYEDALRMN